MQRFIAFVFLFLVYNGGTTLAQTLPVGMPVLEDVYRREQLLNHTDSLVSFTVRPVFTGLADYQRGIAVDTVEVAESLTRFGSGMSFARGNGKFALLPVTWTQQYNSRAPYGLNDGSMIPSAGYQTQLTFGAYMNVGPLSLQLKPEFVSAKNEEYEGLHTDQADIVWAKYYRGLFNVIDLPERFGDEPYHKLLWGQSSVRLNFDPVSVGLSNENLYWGPGIRGSLLMSNNARGFKHITINTTKPVVTPIGSFEGQMIAGRLENSGFAPPEPNRIYLGQRLYAPKPDDWRFISGFVLTYQPKWAPGLFLGAARTSQVYREDAGSKIGDFIPLLQPFEKKDLEGNRDYMSSLFFRWLWKEGMAEIYGEYGHNSPTSLKRLLMQPDDNAAWMVGVRKLVPLDKFAGQFLQFGLELTELQQTTIPAQGGWYTSNSITHGYTNAGEIMGSGIGPGSNLQSVSVSWVKGLKRVGLQVERHLRNNDLYYQIFSDPIDYRKHWVDMSYGLSADWDYKNLIINANASMIRTLNHHYVLFNRPPEYFVPGWDFMNYQVRLGVTYRF